MTRVKVPTIPALPTLAVDPLQDRFERFATANPQIYRELVKLARKTKAAGFSRYSIDSLFHVLRFQNDLRTKSDDGFKLNNSLTSRYSRLIMEREPDLADFFETRNLRAA
jgi:hypothetical protein